MCSGPFNQLKKMKSESLNRKHSPEETEISFFFFLQAFLYHKISFIIHNCLLYNQSVKLLAEVVLSKSLFFCVQYIFNRLSFLLLFLATVQPVQKNLSWEKFLQKKKINKNGWIDAETISSQKESLSSTELWTTSF